LEQYNIIELLLFLTIGIDINLPDTATTSTQWAQENTKKYILTRRVKEIENQIK